MLNGAVGIASQRAHKKDWRNTNNKSKKALGKLLDNEVSRNTQLGLSTLIDVGQAVQDPSDYTNYAELGLDGAAWLGKTNLLRRVPKYGVAVDKAIDWVGDKQPWIDAVVKPAAHLGYQLLPETWKDFLKYSSQLQQAADEANRQAEIAGYR